MTGRGAQRVGALLAVGWLVAFVAADLAVRGPHVVLAALFCGSPLIAAAVLSGRWTGVFGVAATGLAVAAGAWDGVLDDANQSVRVATVAVVSIAAVAVAVVRDRREQRMVEVLAIAEAAQLAIPPFVPHRVGPLRIATRYRSATREALVGGDFYDIVTRPDAVRLLIGDVRGKGMAGVQCAARCIRLFRQSAPVHDRLEDVAAQIARMLAPTLAEEEFVTALLVELDRDGTLRLVNCGHHPPLLVTDGEAATLAPAEPMLPIGLATEFRAEEHPWPAGGRLLLYTDGLVEARDPTGGFLALGDLVDALSAAQPEAALDEVLRRVERHVGGRSIADDLALMLVQHAPKEDR